MRLVFYSGGYPEDNTELDIELIHMLGTTRPKITFIPASYEDSDELFDEFTKRFAEYGFRYFQMFHPDRPFTRSELNSALESDLVYLSGGNTFYFLATLRRKGILNALRKYADGDGLLAGESAGAIIMTRNINTAGIPEFDRDENFVRLMNLNALNLVHFEFFPHYVNRLGYIETFIEYTDYTQRPLFACTDGSGIVVYNDKLSFIGEVWGFINGHRFPLTNF